MGDEDRSTEKDEYYRQVNEMLREYDDEEEYPEGLNDDIRALLADGTTAEDIGRFANRMLRAAGKDEYQLELPSDSDDGG
jgi:hypothetical protein